MTDQPPARVLILADDLTGALDSAGPFAQLGLDTRVVTNPLAFDSGSVDDAQVVALNTASRHMPPGEAAAHVRRCACAVPLERYDFIYKKIDSTLRGNVAVETMSLLETTGRCRALIAPAFPAQGRTVESGVVHVDGVPLAQTGFARDALSPPPLQPLGEIFAEHSGSGEVASWRPGQALPQGQGIVVADAIDDGDLAELFALARETAAQTLFVGSAGLGVEVARHLSHGGQRRSIDAVAAPIVIVVGSRAARSREQVEQLRAVRGSRVLEAPNGIAPESAHSVEAEQIVLLAVSGEAGRPADATSVASRLGETGLKIAQRVGAGAMIVTGGDTAIALIEASGCNVVSVLGDLMPGIPVASIEWNAQRVLLVTKAGGFGSPDALVEAVRQLRSGERTAGAAK